MSVSVHPATRESECVLTSSYGALLAFVSQWELGQPRNLQTRDFRFLGSLSRVDQYFDMWGPDIILLFVDDRGVLFSLRKLSRFAEKTNRFVAQKWGLKTADLFVNRPRILMSKTWFKTRKTDVGSPNQNFSGKSASRIDSRPQSEREKHQGGQTMFFMCERTLMSWPWFKTHKTERGNPNRDSPGEDAHKRLQDRLLAVELEGKIARWSIILSRLCNTTYVESLI